MNTNSEDQKLGRKEREFQTRRAEIMVAAMRLFAGKGFHNTTMSEIAKEAEFSTGSLYNFFKSKEELYLTLMREEIEKIEREVKVQKDRAEGPGVKLEAVVDTLIGYFEKNRHFFQIFDAHRDTFEFTMKGELAEVVRSKYMGFIGELLDVMREGIKQGALKEYEPAELALCFMGVINSFIFLWINTEPKVPLRDKRKVILDIFYHGAGRGKE